MAHFHTKHAQLRDEARASLRTESKGPAQQLTQGDRRGKEDRPGGALGAALPPWAGEAGEAQTLVLPPCFPQIQPACPEGPALHSPVPQHCHQPAPQKHKALPLPVPPCNHGAVMVQTSSRIFLQEFEVPFSTSVVAAGAAWIWCPEQVPMSPGKELCGGEPSKGSG